MQQIKKGKTTVGEFGKGVEKGRGEYNQHGDVLFGSRSSGTSVWI